MTRDQQRIVVHASTLLKHRYSSESTGHDWLHLERVWKMAKKLSAGEKVDMFLVEMGALLHDVDDYKFRKAGEDELKNTKQILAKFSIEDEVKHTLFDIVSHVSFKGGNADDKQKTLEGKIVQDADRLDVLGAIGIARVFAFGGARGHAIYDPDMQPRTHVTFKQYQVDSPSINHFYEKMLRLKDRLNTPQARKIAEHRHQFIETYLKEFWDEVSGLS